MSTKIRLIVSLVLVVLLAGTPAFFARENLPYNIGPGDVLEISVWQHPELDRIVTVRPDGRMSFSLIGDVNANGLTPAKLDEVITGMLSEYVQKPEVTVIVTGVSIKSTQILVLGQVARPGAYPMEESLTVLEAVAKAGSYTERAGLNRVTITRQSRAKTPKVMKVNLKKVITKGDRSGDVILEPGDVVHVPTKASAWTIFDRYFIRGILPVMGFVVLIDTLTGD
jgi:polysaccharide export outer membrane protein